MARLDIALTPAQGIMEEIRYFHPDGTPFRDGVCYGMPFEDFHTSNPFHFLNLQA